MNARHGGVQKACTPVGPRSLLHALHTRGTVDVGHLYHYGWLRAMVFLLKQGTHTEAERVSKRNLAAAACIKLQLLLA